MKKIFLPLFLVAISVILAGGCVSKKATSPRIEESQKTSNDIQTERVASTSTSYILTDGYEYDRKTKTSKEWLSLYTVHGALVKKIDNQHGGFMTGENAYRVNSSRGRSDSPKADDVAYIESFSLRDGKIKAFDFTKTKNTNYYNSLEAIVAFAVSKDEKHLAWQDTNGDVHVSGMNGSDSKIIASGGDRSASILKFSDDGENLHFYKDYSLYSWSLNKNVTRSIDDTDQLVRQRQWVKSPSGRYIAQVAHNGSEYENVILITDTFNGGGVRIPFSTDNLVPPKEQHMTSYAPIIIGFSSDEQKILFGFGRAWDEWAGTFISDISGKNLKLIFNDAEPLAYLSDTTLLVQRVSKGMQIVSLDGKLIKQFPFSETYLDKISLQKPLSE